jgi:hypothetical protein
MVARLKLKEIDGKAPPGDPLESLSGGRLSSMPGESIQLLCPLASTARARSLNCVDFPSSKRALNEGPAAGT